MDIFQKLKILSMAAKYDVACTSSGVSRKSTPDGLGNTEACGICHSFAADGRCISLLKVLMTNYCIYDCQYCVNRISSDVERAAFTPEEIGDLTINFYRRNYIEGLFLSSAVIKSPDYTMELLYNTLNIVRNVHKFNGYIHVKAIPGADQRLIHATGLLADRMSVNIEMPSEESLKTFAPDKTKSSILLPMKAVSQSIIQNQYEITKYKAAPKFVPAGQSTQMIVGASADNDRKIVHLAEGLYKKYKLKRVFYSAYNPVPKANKLLPNTNPPMLREHRLYQADFLLRMYGFSASEIIEEDEDLSLNMDPKCSWALRHPEFFPVEVNTAEYSALLRVPGIGQVSAMRIIKSRKAGKLDFALLKKMGIVLKRAKYFITCDGKLFEKTSLDPEILKIKLTENKINEQYDQLNIFSVVI